MRVFHVDTGARRATVESAAKAIEMAASDVYLAPTQKQEHLNRLEASGRTAWAYGFSSVLIEERRSQDIGIPPEHYSDDVDVSVAHCDDYGTGEGRFHGRM
ncbi:MULTISPECIES: hypothetical protein [Stenotrophomonas]|uniref:hypothetical protein n=1 Tax=Stenotrophomonas TaxID=40323 RepID=UPI0021C61D4A|nr:MULTISPECIES: hypothetical protein [Stenotrophomonas]MCU1137079.1 hypothetical protein [Stenotrophomonas maltophilia]